MATAALEFQFTHPGKGATLRRRRRGAPLGFQFTHPGKGATLRDSRSCGHSQVSIHAPWEGCDGGMLGRYGGLAVFQFTHPGKGAT